MEKMASDNATGVKSGDGDSRFQLQDKNGFVDIYLSLPFSLSTVWVVGLAGGLWGADFGHGKPARFVTNQRKRTSPLLDIENRSDFSFNIFSQPANVAYPFSCLAIGRSVLYQTIGCFRQHSNTASQS
ncbi:hypothetical protein STEG23_020468 [Scotinomys teguina]